jgi:hypothetical protein
MHYVSLRPGILAPSSAAARLDGLPAPEGSVRRRAG